MRRRAGWAKGRRSHDHAPNGAIARTAARAARPAHAAGPVRRARYRAPPCRTAVALDCGESPLWRGWRG